MSDDLETPEEGVEAPVEERPDTSEDSDVSRLTRALEHEREERRQAKEELRRLREDEDYRREFVAQFYEFDDDDEEADDLEEASDLTEYEQRIVAQERRIEELESRLGSRDEQEFRKDFNSHLDQLAEQAGWELDDDDRLLLWGKSAAANKGTPNVPSTVKAFEAFIKREQDRLEKRVAALKSSKKSRHVPGSGKAATQTPNWKDMSADEEVAAMAEMIQGYDS